MPDHRRAKQRLDSAAKLSRMMDITQDIIAVNKAIKATPNWKCKEALINLKFVLIDWRNQL